MRDLEVVFFKANSSRFNDIRSKDVSNRSILVLNTQNLDIYADSNESGQIRVE